MKEIEFTSERSQYVYTFGSAAPVMRVTRGIVFAVVVGGCQLSRI